MSDKLYKVTMDSGLREKVDIQGNSLDEIHRTISASVEVNMKEVVRLFCEKVNDLACENMLKPPYKLEGQHKRAMVLLCKQLDIPLTFSDEVEQHNQIN